MIKHLYSAYNIMVSVIKVQKLALKDRNFKEKNGVTEFRLFKLECFDTG